MERVRADKYDELVRIMNGEEILRMERRFELEGNLGMALEMRLEFERRDEED